MTIRPPLTLVDRDGLSALELDAAREGKFLDTWAPLGEAENVLAVRAFNTREERDDARAARFLGLSYP